MKNAIQKVISLNKRVSNWFDGFIADDFHVYGTEIFDTEIMPKYLESGKTVFDIGGGKHPNIDANTKSGKNLRIIGMDIDAAELKQAPDGFYDDIQVIDITKESGSQKADIILCRALMEHVKDTKAAIENMSGMLNDGGHIMMFLPCRNAVFSRLNLILPESWKLKLLNLAYPEKMHRIGFKAYYNRATPEKFKKMANDLGLEVAECRIFWASRYLEICFPAHIIWRFYQMIARGFGADNLCETFIMVLKKP